MKRSNFFETISSKTPGYALAVVKDGKTVLMKTKGLADLERKIPITAKTAFRLASLSKQFTAMAVMILAERKKLDLGNKLMDFFPDYPAYGDEVTVRQLLTHTAGIPDHEKPLYQLIRKNILGYDRSSRYFIDDDRRPKYSEPTIYDALEVLKRQPNPLFPPGSRYEYSDAGYVLLALIIEKVSGLPYREFLKQNIFTPLAMINSDVFDETKPKIKNRALGYKIATGRTGRYIPRNDGKDYEVFDYDPLNYIVGDEGVYSCIEDMIKWSRGWDEEALISRKSLAEAKTPARLTNGKAGKAGFSWLFGKVLNRFRVPPSLTVRLQELFVHGSRSVIRRAGKPGMTRVIYQDGAWVGFRNIILKIPAQKLTVIILSNRTDLDTERQRISLAYKLAREFI